MLLILAIIVGALAVGAGLWGFLLVTLGFVLFMRWAFVLLVPAFVILLLFALVI
jgi:hypothetical protein